LDLLFEEDSVANLEEADMGLLEAIQEVYNKPGRYAPQVPNAAQYLSALVGSADPKEEEHVNED